jgi:uncharacterized phage protein gp47/JayE
LETELLTGTGFGVSRTDEVLTLSAETGASYDASKSIRVDTSTNLGFNSVSTLIEMVSAETGSIQGVANSITKVETPVAGLDSITNPLDFIVGRELETDTELRTRLGSDVSSSNAATPDAITERILAILDVESVTLIENYTSVVDGDGRPPKSYEILAVGGTDQDIGDVVWASKPAGIETVGSTSVAVTDINGNPKTVKFSRPQEIYVHVRIDYTLYSEESFPSGGEAAMEAAVLAEGVLLAAGEDVIPKRFIGPVYDSTTGLQDVTVFMGTTPNPSDPTPALTEVTIPISIAEVSVFDSTRITTVNV